MADIFEGFQVKKTQDEIDPFKGFTLKEETAEADPFAGFTGGSQDEQTQQVTKERESFIPSFLTGIKEFEREDEPFVPFETEDIPATERIKELPEATLEAGAGVIGGAVAWVPSMIAKFGQVGLHKLTNELAKTVIAGKQPGGSTPEQIENAKKVLKSPEKIQEFGEASEELLASYFGALPEIETESAKRIMNLVGKGMHEITAPARLLASSIPEEYPNLRDFVQFIGEVGTFALIGRGGKSINRKVKSIEKNVKEGKFEAGEAQTKSALSKLVKDKPELQLKEEGVLDLSTPELRQKAIDSIYGETLAKKNQAVIDRIRESELGTEVPPKMEAERVYEDRLFESKKEIAPTIENYPIKAFHGTDKKFKAFSKDFIGKNQQTDFGEGFYFTDSKKVAKSFAKDAGGNEIMDVRLNLKNPAKNKDLLNNEIQLALDDTMGFMDVGEVLKKKGFDGIEFKHLDGSIEYVVFKPEQIITKAQLKKETPKKIIPPEAQKIMDIAKRASFRRLAKNQKGELTIEKLTSAEKEAINRLFKEASVAGIETEKYIRGKGVGKGEARNIVRLGRELKKEAVTDPFTLAEGERRVNISRKANPVVPVGENFLNTLKGLEKTVTPGVIKGFTTSLQKFNKLGPEVKTIYTEYKKRNKARFKETKEIEGQIEGLAKEFPNRKLRKEAGAKGLALTKNGLDALDKMGVTPKEAVKYDPLLQRLEPMFEDLYTRINETRVAIGKKPLRKLANYLPFFAQEHYFDTLNKLFKGEKQVNRKPNLVMDSAEGIGHRHSPGAVEATNLPHIKRGKLRSGTHLELDPIQLYARYANNALNHIHISPINAFVKEVVTKPLKDPKTGENYRLYQANPEVSEFLARWSNSIAGVENLNAPRFLTKAAQKISSNLTAATLYYSLRTMMVQPTALLPTASEFGYIPTTKGLMRTIQRNKKDPIKLSNELEPRVFDAFLNDVAVEFGGTPIQKAKVRAKKWGIAGMKALDYVAAEATWRTAYNSAKGKMSKEKAVNYADEAVVRTQGSGARGDLSPIQMNAIGKAATLWQTFTINNANFIAKDVLGIKNPNLKPKESAARVLRYVIGSAAISTLFEDGMGIQSPQPAPIKEIIRGLQEGDSNSAIALKTMMELAEIVPIGSSLKFGSHPAGPVMGYFGDLTSALSGNEVFHKELLPKALEGDPRSMTKIAELIGKTVGVPGTGQAVKFARGRQRGESIPGAVLGRFQLEKAKGPSKRGRRSRRKSRRSRR